jgi:signal transduction histidine kinase
LLNHLSNAIKFTPAGGRVVVTAEVEPDRIRVQISDTGIGIPEDVMKHLGTLFTQGNDDLSRQHGGIGIGLALCWRLMEVHEDSLTISTIPDAGTTVILTLSRGMEQNTADQEPKNSTPTSPPTVITGF